MARVHSPRGGTDQGEGAFTCNKRVFLVASKSSNAVTGGTARPFGLQLTLPKAMEILSFLKQ